MSGEKRMIFTEHKPCDENYWRSIILFGRNVASYKFALAKALIELTDAGKSSVTLEELAIPYSNHLCEHLKHTDKQVTSTSSDFLNMCRSYNRGENTLSDLQAITVKKGFNNVLDAFHVVNQAEIPVRFFSVDKGKTRTIHITDNLLALQSQFQYENLPYEVEARWRLVETAWSLNLSPRLLQVSYDPIDELLVMQNPVGKRVTITSCRDALNGYQKGKCFYCFSDISVEPNSKLLADVDHFFPHALLQMGTKINLDGVWNLVLACKSCNRGVSGKMARVPRIKYLERLHKRNNFLIQSHHPLRETLLLQTGATEEMRTRFLQQQHDHAIARMVHSWAPIAEHEECF